MRRTSARPFIKSLDELPFPAWDLVDIDRYREIWHGRHGYHSMNIATTRGCPYHCNWCAKPIYGQRYATRSPKAVVEEIAWLKRHFAPDHLWIVDDVFGLKPGWVEEFAALVNEQQRARSVPLPDARRSGDAKASRQALASAGCRMLWMGAESGSQKVLDAMEKGLRVEDIRTREPPAEGRRHRRRRVPAVRLSRARRGPTSKRRCSSRARSSPPTSACRCRIRCRERDSTSASGRSSASSRTGSTRAISRRCTRRPMRPRSIAACTASCITSSARASPRTPCRRSRRARGRCGPPHARRAASWIYNRAALAVTRHRLRPLRAEA